MVAQLLRLKLRLLGNTFIRSPWQLVGLIIGVLYGLATSAVVVLGLVGLRLVDTAIAGPVAIVFGTILTLGFLLVPLAFGVDDTLDPRRFALFGIPTAELSRALAVSALVSVPSVVLIAISIAQVATWSRGAAPVLFALASAVLIVATCVLGARVSTSIAAFVLSSRRARDVTGFVAIVAIVLLSPAIALLLTVDWIRDGIAVFQSLSETFGWTPLGAAWAMPAAAASGDLGGAVVRLLIAGATAAGLWWGWQALVAHMLVTPQPEIQAKRYAGLGWFGRLPATQTGVVLARSLTYWSRDARYRISAIIIPIVPILVIVPLAISGMPMSIIALLPLPVMSLFLAWSMHNDVAYDNTAFWLHVASDTSGVADRLGRVIPALLVGVPMVVLGAVISAAVFGDQAVVGSLIGVSGCILLAGLGLSSVMSARFPYPAVRPGDSPFAQPQSGGAASSLIQSLSFFAVILLAAPAIVLAVLGFLVDPSYHVWSLVVGVIIGVGLFIVGIRWGGRILEARAPELLAFTMRN